MRGYSYGLDSGHVPTREEAKPSVTLKVDLKQYISQLKQLERLVEELNRMEISIELTKH